MIKWPSSKWIMNLFLILTILILIFNFLLNASRGFLIFIVIVSFILIYLQFWRMYKEGKEIGKGKRIFPKHVKKINELNKEQLNLLHSLVELQKKFALYYSFFVLFATIFVWSLIELDKFYGIWKFLFFIIVIPPALIIANKFVYPIRKLQFELFARQNLTINFYNNPLWKRIIFIIIAIILIVAYFLGFMFLVKIERYNLLFPYILVLFEAILILWYVLSLKKERILNKLVKELRTFPSYHPQILNQQ